MSQELENIPQVPANQAEVGQNHNARKAVSALKVKWGIISDKKLNIERALLLPVSISLKTKAIRR